MLRQIARDERYGSIRAQYQRIRMRHSFAEFVAARLGIY
jgi:hypothetical protein